ncbi:MAG: YraN family protein [Hyphomicrobiales bacterium]|nr:YraN family protein [Hyphomicrobiales bacterium]
MGTVAQTRYGSGVAAEAEAAGALQTHGYEVLARRYKSPSGEIDLVVSKANVVSFVEVKRRRSQEEAAWAVTPRQQRRISEAAACWLQAAPAYARHDVTFDAVLIAPGSPPYHMIDAFRPGC